MNCSTPLRTLLMACCFAVSGGLVTVKAQGLPDPPTQPASGPGGANYHYNAVTATQFGDPTRGYWLFEPALGDGDSPTVTAPLPLVLFLPAWEIQRPIELQAWIDHVVRRGAVVAFLPYQRGTEVPPAVLPPTTESAQLAAFRDGVRALVTELAYRTDVPADLDRVAVVGFSFGGTVALYYAATAAAEGLPVPRAVVAAGPWCGGCLNEHLESLENVPAETHVLVIANEDDEFLGDAAEDPARMFAALTAVPVEQRDYVLLRTDDHGRPELSAVHAAAATNHHGRVDAIDWYGTWKLFDGLMACAFDGTWCEYALGNTPEQRYMGEWSDGTPVIEPVITDAPPTNAD